MLGITGQIGDLTGSFMGGRLPRKLRPMRELSYCPALVRPNIQICRADKGRRCMPAIAYLKLRELAVPVHAPYLAEYYDGRFIPPERRAQTLLALHS